jgi:hypothetical protein
MSRANSQRMNGAGPQARARLNGAGPQATARR